MRRQVDSYRYRMQPSAISAPTETGQGRDFTPGTWVAAFVALIVLALAGWRFGRTIADPDLWGHVLNGLDMMEAGGYIGTDTYSYLSGEQPWINHHWLANWIMGFAYDSFGSGGLVFLKALIALGIVGVLVWWLLSNGLQPIRVALVGALLVAVLTPTFGTFRPQIFTVLCAMVLMLVIVAVERGGTRLLWILPPLFVLWTNLHGGALAGLAILGAWAVVHAVVAKGRARWWPLAAFAGSVLGAMVNPEGWGRLRFLLETATVSRPEIQDWQSLDLTSPVGILYLLLAGVCVAALVVDRSNLDLSIVLPLLALMAAPLVAWRHLQLAAVAICVLGASYIANLSSRLGSTEPAPGSKGLRVTAVALSGAVVLSSLGFGTLTPCIEVVAAQFEVPQRAVGSWAGVDPSGNAVVSFNWGEYLRWQLGPEVQVSMDGRRETVYTEAVYQANLSFVEGEDDWDVLLGLAPTDWILAPAASPAVDLVEETGEWTLAYEDDIAVLFSPEPVKVTPRDDLPTDGNGSCFPAGF